MNPNQEKALAALLTNPSKEKAARAAGISTRTLSRYLDDPEFQKRYRAAFDELVGSAANTAKQCLSPAIACLYNIMRDTSAATQARIQAARTLLEYGLKLNEQADIVERIAALERLNE